MAVSRLRIKVGPNEFEGEGTLEAIREQFKLFVQLIGHELKAKSLASQLPSAATVDNPLQKVMRTHGNAVFSTMPTRAEDLVLLMLYGQKMLRNNTKVSGREIMRGLRLSGMPMKRADRILSKHAGNGAVEFSGSGRKRRYVIKPAGIERAQQVVAQLARAVAR
jgi:hypothetical protein